MQDKFSTVNMLKPVFTPISPNEDGTLSVGPVQDTPVDYGWHAGKQVYYELPSAAEKKAKDDSDVKAGRAVRDVFTRAKKLFKN